MRMCHDVKQIAPLGAELILEENLEISSIYLNPLQSYKQNTPIYTTRVKGFDYNFLGWGGKNWGGVWNPGGNSVPRDA